LGPNRLCIGTNGVRPRGDGGRQKGGPGGKNGRQKENVGRGPKTDLDTKEKTERPREVDLITGNEATEVRAGKRQSAGRGIKRF